MSASARKRANQQAANYWPAVISALESEDETHVDSTKARFVSCPECGRLLLGCEHDVRRARTNQHRAMI